MRQFCLDHLSLVDLDALSLIKAAATAGFASVSLFAAPIPISPARDLVNDTAARAEVLSALRSTGLSVGIVEPFMLEPKIDWPHLERLVALTAEIGGTVNMLGMDDDLARLRGSLERLVRICRDLGVPAIIEAFPMSVIANHAMALALAEDLGPDVGLCVDSLHVIRSGCTWADVAALPPARIRHVQLNDGPMQAPEDRGREAALARQLPGDGEFGLKGLLSSIPEHAMVAVEAPLARRSDLTPAQRAAEMMGSMIQLFAS